MGEALRRDAEARRGWRHSLAFVVALLLACAPPRDARAQEGKTTRLTAGRFTIMAGDADLPLARTLLDSAQARDTFPGLPRPRDAVLIAIAPGMRQFHEWAGAGAPEWGAAIAIPSERRIVMQGSHAGSDAGEPVSVLRHELAHLALFETMGDLPPRWFDEGYASYCAREWARDEVLAASVGLVIAGVPPLDSLDEGFTGGAVRAGTAYALAYRAVADLAQIDTVRGLSLFLERWRVTGSMDKAMREAYGLTAAAFEKDWRARTMRRYGALALLANITALAAILGLVLIPLYAARRRRDRRRLDAMRAQEEATERAARQSAIEALLASAVPPPPPPGDGDSHGSR
jgi:hypothetical protein